MNTKEREDRIHDLKVKRSKQWQMKKESRDYDYIERLNAEINDLKEFVKKSY